MPSKKLGAAATKMSMSLRPKSVQETLQPKKKRRTSAEVAADKAAKELAKQTKSQERMEALTAKVLQISQKENAMALEDQLADAQANHSLSKSMTKVLHRITLVLKAKP